MMRVSRQLEYRWHSDGSGPSIYTQANITEFCCLRLEKAWNADAVGFGEANSSYGEQGGVNIYHCSPYPEGAVWDEYPIDFCPFCGIAIEVKSLEAIRTS